MDQSIASSVHVPAARLTDSLAMPRLVLEPLGEPIGTPVLEPLAGALIGLGLQFLANYPRTNCKQGSRQAIRSTNPTPEPGLGEAPPSSTQSQSQPPEFAPEEATSSNMQLQSQPPEFAPEEATSSNMQLQSQPPAPETAPPSNTQLQHLEPGVGDAPSRNAQSQPQSPQSPPGEAPFSSTQSQSAVQSLRPPVAIESNNALKRNRDAPLSVRATLPDDHRRPLKKKKTANANNKFSWELGHKFHGFVAPTTRDNALEFSNIILQLPVPKYVRKRLVYFCDGSIRFLCGAAGIVWPRSFNFPDWEGTGVYYPLSIDNTATLELFAIAATLQAAIKDMDKTRGDVAPRTDKTLFRGNLAQTKSHQHHMTKEVFIFTDDMLALKRICGRLAYQPEEDIAHQLKAISEHSLTLHGLGVHVELHLSPGHSGVPGNEAADRMARKAQESLVRQTVTSWPTEQSMKSEPATASLGSACLAT
ncbi:hypothetical protein N7463_001693 [Penicillium fimorum]|uniref:RNase H type-1 domain-containing protein n=1 Tax=Penicillium fimorum TaxID=1882269 RepID=A0A9W9XXU7_9EURO|nr:hypothetical protein N7463_001693 [Penicillium fimorum]